jgi:hypothetical protein
MHAKVVRLVLVGLLGVFVWHWVWADEQFVKQAEFTVLVAAVDQHIKKMDIMAAKAMTGRMEIQLQIAEATDAPEKEVRLLKKRVAEAQAYEDCLVFETGKCEFIIPRE